MKKIQYKTKCKRFRNYCASVGNGSINKKIEQFFQQNTATVMNTYKNFLYLIKLPFYINNNINIYNNDSLINENPYANVILIDVNFNDKIHKCK